MTLYREAVVYESHMPGKYHIYSFHHLWNPKWCILAAWIYESIYSFLNQSILRWSSSTRLRSTCWIFARFAVVTSVLIVRISAALPSRPNSHLRCVSFCVVCWPTRFIRHSPPSVYSNPINCVILKSFILSLNTLKNNAILSAHYLECYFNI